MMDYGRMMLPSLKTPNGVPHSFGRQLVRAMFFFRLGFSRSEVISFLCVKMVGRDYCGSPPVNFPLSGPIFCCHCCLHRYEIKVGI